MIADVKDISLTSLEAIARDRMRNGTASERAEWTKVYKALGIVAGAEVVTREWVACLNCPLAFPTVAEQTSHYWAEHR